MNLAYRISWCVFRLAYATYFHWRVYNPERVPLKGPVVLAANAHLIHVATRSQPACVEHVRQGDAGAERGQYAAAQSSCSPLPTGRTGSP